MLDRVDLICRALERHTGRSVKVMSRKKWSSANHPDGRPVKLPRPFPPFRAIERTGSIEVAVASAQSYADVPGFHIVRRDPKDAPNIFNTDSHDVIEDLTKHELWPRVLAMTGIKPDRNFISAVRRRVFLVETRRGDHHSPTVPPDIASAEPKDAAPGPPRT